MTNRGLSQSTLFVILLQANLRPTRQRLVLSDMIFGWGDWHFTPAMIASRATALPLRLSIGAIYNALQYFSDAGLLREIAVFGSTTWCDANTGPQCHLFIEATGELIDLPEGGPSALASPPIPEKYDVAAFDILVRVRERHACELPQHESEAALPAAAGS